MVRVGGSQTQARRLIAKAGSCFWLHACLSQLGAPHSPLLFTAIHSQRPSLLSFVCFTSVHRRHPQSFYRYTTLHSLPRTHLPSIHSLCVVVRGYFPRGNRQVSSSRLLSRRPPFQHCQTAQGIVDRASSSTPSRLLTTPSPPSTPYSLSLASTAKPSH